MKEPDISKRVSKNTMMLYIRQLVILFVSLYTVRIILAALGETDYGLYQVVAGIVSMFSIISGAMSTASQRFFCFDLGKQDNEHLKISFSMTIIAYVIVIVTVVALMETVGLWYLLNQLSIPKGREFAALFVYQTATIGLCFTFITTPYMAMIIAYEDMNAYAIVSMIEAGLKLMTAFAVKYYTKDRLVIYGVLTAFSTIIVTFCYRMYCRQKYKENSKFQLVWDGKLFGQILSFTSWNLFGSAIYPLKLQGVNVLLNQAFDQVVITSRGIASSVGSAIQSFGQNFSNALKPVIIKEYAMERYGKVEQILGSASKITFFLVYIFVLPLCMEMDYILSLWLGSVPAGAGLFTTLTLVEMLVEALGYPLSTVAQATGKIRLYQSVVGGVQLLNFPSVFVAVKLGMPAYGAFIISILLCTVAFCARLMIIPRLMKFNALGFIKRTIVPIALAVPISVWPICHIAHLLQQGVVRLVFTIVVSLFWNAVVFWLIVANKEEKQFIVKFIMEKFKK